MNILKGKSILTNYYLFLITGFLCFLSVYASIARTGDGEAMMRTGQISFDIEVNHIPDTAKNLDLLVPVPLSGRYQKISGVEVQSSLPWQFRYDTLYGNKILHAKAGSGQPVPDSFSIHLHFDFERKEVTSTLGYEQENDNISLFLSENRLIPLGDSLRQYTERALNKNEEKALPRLFYDHLRQNMSYDKSGTGWGKGNALYACSAERGNCTDFHSLFIGMCRISEIPARFEIGYVLPPEGGKISGYHCWAKFYDKEKGWIPVDISEASKDPSKKKYYYGNLDANRLRFSTGRDIPVKINKDQIVELNYFVHPKLYINDQSYKDLDYNIQLIPGKIHKN